MGAYSASFAAGLIVIQTTVLLLRRSATQWSFYVVERDVVWPYNLDDEVRAYAANSDNSSSSPSPQQLQPAGIFGSPHFTTNQQTADCLASAWSARSADVGLCFQRPHQMQRVTPVLAPWNPHLIILVLCCTHLVITLASKETVAAAQQRSGGGGGGNGAPLNVSTLAALAAVCCIVTVSAVVCAIDNMDQLRYPTIITCVALLLAASWFAFVAKARPHSDGTRVWVLTCHLQFVSVPLAVTVLAAMGVRFWLDLVSHAVLLSAAVNTLWLQKNLATAEGRDCVHPLTVFLVIYCALVAQMEWSLDSGQMMACVGLAPLLLLTLFASPGGRGWGRSEHKISSLCISAALLSAVANFAML